MSVRDNRHAADRAALEKMSTQALKDLLCQVSDQYTASDDESSMILEIAEVLTAREDNNDDIRLNVDAALETFRKEFLPSADIDPKIPQSEIDDGDVHAIRALPKKKNRAFAKVAGIAAAIAIVIFAAGCLIPTANGSNLWSAFARWTRETFGLNPVAESAHRAYPEELAELHKLLNDYEIPAEGLLPVYIPEGYEAVATDCVETEFDTMFLCQLQNDSDIIFLSYLISNDDSGKPIYEKNDSDPEQVTINGQLYYIVQNVDLYSAIWQVHNVEASIQNVRSHDELLKIINSISTE